jgi:hypothetical protein
MAKKKAQHGAGIKDVLSKVNRIAKDTKVLSRGLSLIPNPIAQGASFVADQLGYGRHRVQGTRVHSQFRAGAIRSMPTHPRSQLDVLTHPGGFVVGTSVNPPRIRRKRAQHGAGFFSDLGGGIGSVFGGLGQGIGSVAHGLFG